MPVSGIFVSSLLDACSVYAQVVKFGLCTLNPPVHTADSTWGWGTFNVCFLRCGLELRRCEILDFQGSVQLDVLGARQKPFQAYTYVLFLCVLDLSISHL